MYFPSADLDETFMESVFTIIGCGHVNQQVIFNLSKLDVKMLHLIDKDTIEAKNISSTLFNHSSVHQTKVSYLGNLVTSHSPMRNTQTYSHYRRFEDMKEIPLSNFYISGLDSGNARISVFEFLLENLSKNLVNPYYIDIRANFNFANIYVVRLKDEGSIKYYREDVKALKGTAPERDCGRYNHPLTVSLIGAAVIRIIDAILKGQPIDLNIITVNTSLMKIEFFPEIELVFENPPDPEPIKEKPVVNTSATLNNVSSSINRIHLTQNTTQSVSTYSNVLSDMDTTTTNQ